MFVQHFLNSLNNSIFEKENVRWRVSNDDISFFEEVVSVCKIHRITNVLDIACGTGNLIKLLNKNNIKSWGIDPQCVGDNIYKGTFDTVIKNQEKLWSYKFDCISVTNTLHGKYHTKNELEGLFLFFKNHSKYIVISNPSFDGLLDYFKLVHIFEDSHSDKSVEHRMYYNKTINYIKLIN